MSKVVGYCTISKDFKNFLTSGDAEKWTNENFSDAKRKSLKIPVKPDNLCLYCYLDKVKGLDDLIQNLIKSCKQKEIIEIVDEAEKFEIIYAEPHNPTRFYIVRYNIDDNRILVPAEFVENVESLKDYRNLNVKELKGVVGPDSNALTNLGDNDSVSSLESQKEELLNKTKAKEDEIKKLKDEVEEEIQKFREKLELKLKEKTDLIASKISELNEMKTNLEKQIFVLESQIYSIRCYTGEIIDFKQIKSGKACTEDTPIVVNQKLRYLDEELGKAVSIYNFDGKDVKTFENLLANREDICNDLFAPQEKSISFVKISKNNKFYFESTKYANVLKTYKKFHGKTIGIIVRNGENLFIGWTDEDMIAIPDDNAFYNPNVKVESYIDDSRGYCSSSTEEKLSRLFIFSILQGILDRQDIIKIPEKINIMRPSKYLVFSFADGWIKDNKYGDFRDLISKYSAFDDIKEGNEVLTIMNLRRDDYYDIGSDLKSSRYESNSNVRGRGDANRTHDAYAKDKKIYKINKVDRTDVYSVQYLIYPYLTVYVPSETKGNTTYFTSKKIELQGPPKIVEENDYVKNYKVPVYVYNWNLFKAEENDIKVSSDGNFFIIKTQEEFERFHSTFTTKREYSNNTIKVNINGEDCRYYYTFKKRFYHVTGLSHTDFEKFVCVEGKTWSYTPMKVNFEVRDGEVINLTYLNSLWIKHVIMNKDISSFGNHKFDFANVIRYLNAMLDYLKKREETEAEMISQYEVNLEDYPEWQVQLSEWKFENKFSVLTEARAKRFAKTLKN